MQQALNHCAGGGKSKFTRKEEIGTCLGVGTLRWCSSLNVWQSCESRKKPCIPHCIIGLEASKARPFICTRKSKTSSTDSMEKPVFHYSIS